MDGMTFFRFKGGRIVEEWSIMDIATMVHNSNQQPRDNNAEINRHVRGAVHAASDAMRG